MKLPRDLDGRTLVKMLCRDWGYRFVHQEGSHIILQTDTPTHQRLPVPDHSPLRVGTLGASCVSSPRTTALTARRFCGGFDRS